MINPNQQRVNNQTQNIMNLRHTISSAPKSLKDIENLDIDDDDEDTKSVQTYKSNISEITNSTYNMNNMRNQQQYNQSKNQQNIINKPQIQQQNRSISVNNYQDMEKLYEDQMRLLNTVNRSQSEELVPRRQNNFRCVDEIQNYNDEDEEEGLREVLDESNEEFVDFKANVREWLKLDDDIKTLQHAMSERRKKKNELTPKVLEFMGKYEIEDLNTHEGKVAYAKSMITKPMNKDYLKLRLTEYLKSMDKAEKCTKYLMENRIKEERVRLKRINPRKKEK